MSFKPDSTGNRTQLRISEQYRMNVVGRLEIDTGYYHRELTPYGWIQGIRTFVNEGVRFQPGDKILAQITQVRPKSAFAKALDNYGNFIEPMMKENPDKRVRVRLTGKSRRDARNAVSEPERNGGFLGMFTIVNNVSDERSVEGLDSDSGCMKCMIKLNHFGVGKHGRYYLAGSPVNPDNLRSGDEIFIGELDGGEDPELSTIRSFFYGVPFDPGIALYFGDGEKREILFRSRPMDVSYLEKPATVVRKFAGYCLPGTFRVALAREDAMEWVEQAIEEAGFQHDMLEPKRHSR